VTRISGFEGDGDLATLAADLKRSLGTGGSTEGDAVIILQGDRRADATRWLIANGYKARSV
jgi:translation initiation factor 1